MPRRFLCLISAFGVALALAPAPAAATVTGGCTAKADASVTGSQDLTSLDTWHLKHADVVKGEGKPPSEQTGVGIGAYVFGIPFTLYSDSSKGKGGSAGPYKVSDYDFIASVIEVSGSSGSGACTGKLLVIVDDKSPFTTVLGAGSVALIVLGLLLLLAAVRTPGVGGRLVGLIAGLLIGAGAALLATQLQALRPDNIAGIAIVGGAAIVGAAAGGNGRRRPVAV